MSRFSNISCTLTVGLVALAMSAASADGFSDDRWGKSAQRGKQACSTHARLLRHACYADRQDDYLVHIADCVYVSSAEDERECRKEAREESTEKSEECRDVYEARLEVCDLVGEERFDVEFDPAEFVDPNAIGDTVDPNPYWPLTAGHTHVIIGRAK